VPIGVQTLVLLYGAYAVVEGGLAVAAAMIGPRPAASPGGCYWPVGRASSLASSLSCGLVVMNVPDA